MTHDEAAAARTAPSHRHPYRMETKPLTASARPRHSDLVGRAMRCVGG